MADRAKKISELPTAASVVNNDIFIIVANTSGVATTKQISVNTFKSVLSGVVVPTANSSVSGTVKVGSGVDVNTSGFLNANIGYGNTTAVGLVAAGNNVYINANGYLGIHTGNTSVAGVVYAGNNVYINANGYLGVVGANTTTRGVVQVGDNLTVGAGAVLALNSSITVDSVTVQGADVSANLNVSGQTVLSGQTFFGTLGANNDNVMIHIHGTLHSNLMPHTPGNYQIGNTTQYWQSLFIDGFSVQNGATAPANSTATGTKGQIAFDTSYGYVCIATDTWKRAALSTW